MSVRRRNSHRRGRLRNEDVVAASVTPERVTVVVRGIVVLSIGVLLLAGPDSVRRHLEFAAVVFAVALGYAIATLVRPSWESRRSRSAWVLTAVDATLALAAVAVTGGSQSPGIAILFLVVVAAAIRLPVLATVGLTTFVISVLALIALLVDTASVDADTRVLAGVWWTVYLALTAALGASLSLLAEREQHARLRAIVELEAEHAAAEEERDLRERLLQSYQAQQDGLRVILHEFRTPVVSLDALAKRALAPTDGMDEGERLKSLYLILEHAGHLAQMLNALSDVAASRSPNFGDTGRRIVDMRSVVLGAADAARLPAERLRLVIADDVVAVRVDGQRLRRVLTNLVENAARHGVGRPVDVEVGKRGKRLLIMVADRGPGVADEDLVDITAKNVTLGDRRGTAGLGLWIVHQILEALGGRLRFTNRPGGGLIAHCEIPLD